MSASFEVQSSTGSYKVEIAAGGIQKFLDANKKLIAICDERFDGDLKKIRVKAIPLQALESVKSLDAIAPIIGAMRQGGASRDTLLFAIGGGIVQDTAAFCAAIYMRGLTWVYAPTTLLGMVDSCIGGKSSINVGQYKNLVGTFNPPQQILIDPDYIKTLSVEQKVAGLAEAAKICFCRGPETWDAYMACKPALQMDSAGFEKLILTSLAAKKWFIEIDEFDHKERLLLNFGHTFGHALEGASEFRVSHGVAVGIGMLCAMMLGKKLGRDFAKLPRVEALRSHVAELLAAIKELPDALKGVTPANLFDRFTADKKHKADAYRLITLTSNGLAELISLPKNDMSKEQITASMDEVLTKLRA